MRYEFFSGESAAVEEIDPFSWLAGAIGLLFICVAFLIWILVWAADNGIDTISAWGIQFAMAVVQDILLNQPIKLYIMHVVAVEVLRPRLRHIYNILNIVVTRSESLSNSVGKNREIFSVAVVQHMSATCRAARNKLCSMLPSSKMLAAITDYDVFLCREAPRSSLTTISCMLIMIPTVLALTNEWIQDGSLTVAITALWALFMVANDQLLQISVWALIAPYLFIFLVIVMDLFVMSPRRKRAATPAKYTGLERHGGKGWRRTARQNSVIASKPINQRTKSVLKKVKKGVSSAATPANVTTAEEAEKRQQDVIWRNMNLPIFLQATIGKSSQCRQSNITSRASVRRRLKHRASTLTEDRDQLAVISPEVLDMRFSTLAKSMQKKNNVSLKKRMESFLWHPDVASNQRGASMAVKAVSRSRVSLRISNSAIVQRWLQHRKDADSDASYWAAYCAFVEFDENQSGYLEVQEIQRLAECIWQQFNPNVECSEEECDDVVDGLLSTLDPEGKQCISFEAFLPWYKKLELSIKDYEQKDSTQRADGRMSRGLRGLKFQDEETASNDINDNNTENSIILTGKEDSFVFE